MNVTREEQIKSKQSPFFQKFKKHFEIRFIFYLKLCKKFQIFTLKLSYFLAALRQEPNRIQVNKVHWKCVVAITLRFQYTPFINFPHYCLTLIRHLRLVLKMMVVAKQQSISNIFIPKVPFLWIFFSLQREIILFL